VTSRPPTSYTDTFTSARSGNAKWNVVAVRNGFGEFCGNANARGTAAIASTPGGAAVSRLEERAAIVEVVVVRGYEHVVRRRRADPVKIEVRG
jgi:hypothetical protein